MSIASSAMLVELNISTWGADKKDKQATDKVVSDHGAVSHAAKVTKNLMAGTTMRKAIADYAASCRLWHIQRTMPWSDKGARLLPTSLFFSEYKSEINARRSMFNSMVDDFIAQYPTEIQTVRAHLSGLWNPDDYPSAEEVRRKFDFKLVFSPVPQSNDFRLSVPEQDLAELREQYEKNFSSRVAEALKEPWDRLHKMLTGMSEKLVDDPTSEVKKRYHDTFVTNAQALCALLTHLNVTNDPKLEQARRDLEITMLGADVEVIKESPEARKSMKGKLDDILNKYEW